MSTENHRPETTPENEKRKLTDTQLRILQIVAGLIAAAAMIVSIFVASLRQAEDNFILQYLFLIVFLVVMFGRRQVEKRYRLRLNLFSLAMIDGIVVGIMIYTALAFFNPSDGAVIELDDTYKILIIVGIGVLLLCLGVILPFVRYRKRKEEGTLVPIRLPEPEEDEEEATVQPHSSAPSSIQQQINEMTQELDEKSDDDNDK